MIVGKLTQNSQAVDNLSTPELKSYIAAQKVLAGNYALHVAVAEHAQAVNQLGKATLQDAVQFFLRHHRSEVGRVPLSDLYEFIASEFNPAFRISTCRICRGQTQLLVEAFPGEGISDLTTAVLDDWLWKVAELGTQFQKTSSLKDYRHSEL